jgi:hypothetical protein
MVINPRNYKSCGCVYADSGPAGKIGEDSIALAESVGVPSNPKNGGVGHGIVYIVFPNTSGPWPIDKEAIKAGGQKLFELWGGLERLKLSLPEIRWLSQSKS